MKNHESADELLVGFYKKGSGKPSITWPESVDQALCFGWIDGVRRSFGEDGYTIRFTPRRAKSFWSLVNVKRAKELIAEGLMQPAGLAAFEKRDEKRTGQYAYERESAAFDKEMEKKFRANARAWKFFEAQPPGFRKQMTVYVMTAKQAETRERRLQRLIDASAAGRRLY